MTSATALSLKRNGSGSGGGSTPSPRTQTIQLLDFAGTYLGGRSYKPYGCTPASLNNQIVSDVGYVTITQSGNSLQVRTQGDTATCTFSGVYSQNGQLGATDGTFTCDDGPYGTFGLAAMQWTIGGMSAVIAGRSQYCNFEGVIGGVTDNHFLP